MKGNKKLSEDSLLIKDEDYEEERCCSYLRFPTAVYFIIITELCERFNYYGMRTILILYLTQHVLMRESNAVSIYHLFISLCYFTTIFSSFLADNYFGKYKTVVAICSLYLVGSVLMSITSIVSTNLSGPLLSLILIAVGTGGVKACVGPFGGDQIPPNKKVVLDSFFSMFYFALNVGALLSTILTPILRADVSCNGSDDCYPLAFGVPAILMAAALLIFVMGRTFYIEVPVKESVYIKAAGCIAVSIKLWYRNRHNTPKKQLLDYASDQYDAEFIHDLRTLFRISILYLPLPIYWALYEQLGSTWTLQAAQMDGEIAPNIIVLPDQVSLLNIVLVMAMIPVFDGCIYPLCYRIEQKLKPLRRMTIGISFAALSFFAAFILQNQIEAKQPLIISQDYSRLVLVNSYPCDLILTLTDGRQLSAHSYYASVPSLDLPAGTHNISVSFVNCLNKPDRKTIKEVIFLHQAQINFLIVDMEPGNKVSVRVLNDFHIPNSKGHPMIRLAASTSVFNQYQFRLKDSASGSVQGNFMVTRHRPLYLSDWIILSHTGRFHWDVKFPTGPNFNSTTKWLGVLKSYGDSLQVHPIKIFASEVSIFYMTFPDPKEAVVVIPLLINNGSQISVLWQIPQYILISVGEVLVSITGLSFSYHQAPEGMKSLVNALWYFSSAVGNIIVMIVFKIHILKNQSLEYLVFGIMCVVFNAVFAGLAYFYRMSKKEESDKIIETKSTEVRSD